MTAALDVLKWADRILSKRGAPPHELLELRPNATLDEAQTAFHKIARTSHPDLHRNTLRADQLEKITNAYALVAGAYQNFREQSSKRRATTQAESSGDGTPPPAVSRTTTNNPVVGRTTTGNPVVGRAATANPVVGRTPTPNPALTGGATAQMTPRAVLYYRKAEGALQRGDLKSAALQLKLAIAADPLSPFLRAALAEVEREIARG